MLSACAPSNLSGGGGGVMLGLFCAGLVRMGQEPDEASSRQTTAAGGSRQHVKQEGQGAAAGVKRQRGEGDAVPRSATADTVDLTGQVRLAESHMWFGCVAQRALRFMA
jgi:hypothetical protein